jgi:hypothetical protein
MAGNESLEERYFRGAPVFGRDERAPPSAPPRGVPARGPARSPEDEYFTGAPTFTGGEPMAPQPAKPEPEVGLLEDIGRAAGSGLTRGAIGLAGLPGDIESLGRLGAQKLGYDVSPISALPTSERMISRAEEALPALKGVTQYQPATGVGRYAKAGAEFLPGAIIPGGSMGIGARAAGQVTAGMASHAVEDYLKGKPLEGTGYQTAGQLAAALAGGMAGSSLAQKAAGAARTIMSPTAAATERLASGLSKDAATKTALGTMAEAERQGIAPAAIASKQTQATLERAGEVAREDARGAFNQAVADFKEQAVEKFNRHIDNTFGGGAPVNALSEMDSVAQRVRQVNDANYTRVMSSPKARVVPPAAIAPAEARIRTMFGDQFVSDIGRSMVARGENPAAYGLIQNGRDFAISPRGASLRFWDEAKQYIDDSINKLYDPVTRAPKPGTNSEIATLTALKKTLVGADKGGKKGVLDRLFPDYEKIRFEGSELYNARNAIDAGYKYFADKNYPKITAKEKAATRLAPQQRRDFAYGYAGAYRDFLEKKPEAALKLFSGPTAAMEIRKARMALGPAQAEEMIGLAHAQFLSSNIKALATNPKTAQYWAPVIGGAAGEVVTSAVTGQALLSSFLSGGVPVGAIAGALLASAGKRAYSARERKVAEELLRQAADPQSWPKLGAYLSKNAEARTLLDKLYTAAARGAPVLTTQKYEEPPPLTIRPGRASGGAVNLKALANAAKRAVCKSTEDLLQAPDVHVVQALKVATQHI